MIASQIVRSDSDDTQVTIQDCHTTSQVRIHIDDDTNNNDHWILTSLDRHGTVKTMGGDEFYITYTSRSQHDSNQRNPPLANWHFRRPEKYANDNVAPHDWWSTLVQPPTAVAHITDTHNGRYELTWWSTNLTTQNDDKEEEDDDYKDDDEETGILRIYFVFSCGLGRLEPPAKANWTEAGKDVSFASFTIDVPRPRRIHHTGHTINAPQTIPYTYSSASPTATTTTTTTTTTTSNQESPLRRRRRIDFGQYDQVIFIGDSLLREFVGAYRSQQCRKGWDKEACWYTNVRYICILQLLSTRTMERDFLRHIQNYLETEELLSVATTNTTTTTTTTTNHPRLALVLGSAMHDLIASSSLGLDDHLQAVETYVRTVQDLYPMVDVYWKLPTYVHTENVNVYGQRQGIDQCKYMSVSRMEYLYQQQKAIMQSWNIPVIDTYRATMVSGHLTWPHDARHFLFDLEFPLLQQFYSPETRTTLLKDRVRRDPVKATHTII